MEIWQEADSGCLTGRLCAEFTGDLDQFRTDLVAHGVIFQREAGATATQDKWHGGTGKA